MRAHPEDLRTATALALALVRNSRLDEGLAILRAQVERFADNPDVWDDLLLGLDEAGKFDELARLARLPSGMTNDPRFDRYRGTVAQHQQDWPGAAELYRRAWRADPSDFRILYRLSRVLRAGGRLAEAESLDRKVHAAQEAKDRVLPLYEEADAVKTLGIALIRSSITGSPTCAIAWAATMKPWHGIVWFSSISPTTRKARKQLAG